MSRAWHAAAVCAAAFFLPAAAAWAWPTGPPAAVFPVTANGVTVICEQWGSRGVITLDCPVPAFQQLSWPPVSARPSQTWTQKHKGRLFRCRRWDGYDPKTGGYMGFVAVCQSAANGPVA